MRLKQRALRKAWCTTSLWRACRPRRSAHYFERAEDVRPCGEVCLSVIGTIWHVVPRRKHGRPLVENNLSFCAPTLVSEVMRMRMLLWHNPRTGRSSPIDYLALCSTLEGHLMQPQWPNTDDMAVSCVFSSQTDSPATPPAVWSSMASDRLRFEGERWRSQSGSDLCFRCKTNFHPSSYLPSLTLHRWKHWKASNNPVWTICVILL